MQIMIDIPDGCYEELNNGQFPVQDAYRLVAWINNGTPLPDGAEILTKDAYSDLCRRAADVPDTNVGELPSARLETHEKRTETHACDCISRQAVLREFTCLSDNAFVINRKIQEIVKKLPPVTPQPEVIRCKDCKHWTNNIGDSKLRDNYCNDEAHGFYYQCSEDDYCSFAERRTDG